MPKKPAPSPVIEPTEGDTAPPKPWYELEDDTPTQTDSRSNQKEQNMSKKSPAKKATPTTTKPIKAAKPKTQKAAKPEANGDALEKKPRTPALDSVSLTYVADKAKAGTNTEMVAKYFEGGRTVGDAIAEMDMTFPVKRGAKLSRVFYSHYIKLGRAAGALVEV